MSQLKIYAWSAIIHHVKDRTSSLLLSNCTAHSEEEAEGMARKVIKNDYEDHRVNSILIRYICDDDNAKDTVHEYENTRITPEFQIPKHF